MLSNRNRGGIAAFSGHEYERFFGISRVVLGLERRVRGVRSKFAPQLKGAEVDDWVEVVGETVTYFQLRRRKNQTWSRGLRQAFSKQRERTPAGLLRLVVHLIDVAISLKASQRRPPRVDVEVFPDWQRRARTS